MSLIFDIQWYRTMQEALLEQRELLNRDVTDKEFAILLEQLRDAPDVQKNYFNLIGKQTINLTKCLAIRNHLKVYKEQIKKQLYSLILNAKDIIEKDFTAKTYDTLNKFLQDNHISYTENDLINIIFICLVTFHEKLLPSESNVDTPKNNYAAVTKALALKLIDHVRTTNLLIRNKSKIPKEFKNVDYWNLIEDADFKNAEASDLDLEEETKMISLGDILLQIFTSLGIVNVEKHTQTISASKTIAVSSVSLTKAGRKLLLKTKKIDFQFYKRLPTMHPPFPIDSNLNGNLHFKMKREIEKDLLHQDMTPTPLIIYMHGVSINREKSDLRVVQQSFNYISSRAYSINFELFYQYVLSYPSAFSTEFSTAMNPSPTFSFLPNPIQKPSDLPRTNYIFQKLQYCLNVSLVLIEELSSNINAESEVDKKLLLELKHALTKFLSGAWTMQDLRRAFLHIYFWVPRILCSRLRMYEILIYLFSGSELERSLIFSSESKPLEDSFSILANLVVTLYGFSPTDPKIEVTKYSWNEKIALFVDYFEFYKNNLNYKSARKPYLYTACIEELNRCNYWDLTFSHKSKSDHISSKLTISLDNTSSGLQLLSLLTGSKNESLNLCIQDDTSKIEDTYARVALLVSQRLQNDPLFTLNINLEPDMETFLTTHPLLVNCIALIIRNGRKLSKSIMMPLHYGITQNSINKIILKFLKEVSVKHAILKPLFQSRNLVFNYQNEQVKWVKEHGSLDQFESKIFKKDSQRILHEKQAKDLVLLTKTISSIFLNIIAVLYPKVDSFYKHLRNFAGLVSFFQQPLTWTPPGSDIYFNQKYFRYDKTKYVLPRRRRQGRIKTVTLKIITKRNKNFINRIRMMNSWPANIVHSIDSFVLHSTVSGQTKQQWLNNTLHDNFIIHPESYHAFYNHYIHVLQKIFTTKHIEEFFTSLPKPSEVLKNFLTLYKVEKIENLRGKKFKPKVESFFKEMCDAHEYMRNILLSQESIETRSKMLKDIKQSRHIITM